MRRILLLNASTFNDRSRWQRGCIIGLEKVIERVGQNLHDVLFDKLTRWFEEFESVLSVYR